MYTITLHKTVGFRTKLKKVKGHTFVESGLMMVIYEDERREFINTQKFSRISFCDGWFKQELETVKEDLGAEPSIKSGAK